VFESLTSFATLMYDPGQLKLLLALVAADVLLAIAVALFKGTFNLGQLADFLRTRLAPFLLAYTGIKLVALADPSLDLGVTVVWAAIIAAEVGRIIGHIGDIGLPVPGFLKSPPVER
jgi:hypothetical protein